MTLPDCSGLLISSETTAVIVRVWEKESVVKKKRVGFEICGM